MKIRNDFVTNSSSSSYIIAFKEFPKIDDETLKKYPFLKSYSKIFKKVLFSSGESYSDTTAGTIYHTKEEYDEIVKEDYRYSGNTIEEILNENPYFREMYEEVINYLNKGYLILIKEVDYNDSFLENLIKEFSKEGMLTVLSDG